ncbi:cytochrome P450 [Peniophora sp. CONT]|nr:cytochrome P450 [Peniophora sp. CONT]
MDTVNLLAYAALAVYLARLWMKRNKAVRSVGKLPGPTTLLEPTTLLSNLLPRIPFISNGTVRELATGYADFAAVGYDAYAHKHVWPEPGVTLYVADPDMIKEITTYRSRFPKPVWKYGAISFFGKNIVASEGEDWKRYRKISAPAFSESNSRLVWDETSRVVYDLIDNVWKRADTVHIDHVLEVTLPIALFTISAASFGRCMTFTEELESPPGFTMNFKDALRIASENVIIKLSVPKSALCLTQRYREVDLAYNELERYMTQMIHSRRQLDEKEERHDLFSSLLDAADRDTESERKLQDSELIGNTFIFLLAGHETAAHTLAFCFALLALYPDKQEKLFQNTKDVISSLGHSPGYDDMSQFTYSIAVFYETLRIRPSIPTIPKYSAEDTALNVKGADGQTTTIPVPKGTEIEFHVPGLHNNPRYWDRPDEFRPERFLGEYNKDAFLPFSGGPRACVGRRFAETEAVALLTIFISQYRVSVKEDPKYAAETHEQCRARILKTTTNNITAIPVQIPLTFDRRM